MLHLIICRRRENSRNVQGIQVRVLLMLMRCLLQSNSNYPFRGCKEFGVLHYLHYSLRVWEPMKVQFSRSGDDQQYICLHVSKMVSLDAKFVQLLSLSGSVQWHQAHIVYFSFIRERKKQMISRTDQQWPKSVLGQITVTHLDNHNRPLENRLNSFEFNLCRLHMHSILQLLNEFVRRQCGSSMLIMA